MSLSPLFQPGTFAALPGWREDDQLAAFEAFRRGAFQALKKPYPSGSLGVRSAVDSLLTRRGISLVQNAPVTPGTIPPGSVRVVVSRASASVPGCPDWSRPSTPDFVGSTTSNYGCASNSALAAMVADPTDLVQGREAGAASDPATASKAIRVYRETAPTGTRGLKVETTSKGGN